MQSEPDKGVAFKNKRIPVEWNIDDFKSSVKTPVGYRPVVKYIANHEEPPKTGKRKKKKPTTIKKSIERARDLESVTSGNEDFSHLDDVSVKRECTALDIEVTDLLRTVMKRQDIMWKKNENKARAHRNIICGIHETLKHIIADNVVCIFVATNIDAEVEYGAASAMYNRLRTTSLQRGIPLIHASSKKDLSKAVLRFPYTNVVGLMRFQGLEDQLKHIISLWNASESHIRYHIDQNSIFP